MKAHIQIPRGWRRLRVESLLKNGDRYFCFLSLKWIVTECHGLIMNDWSGTGPLIYIRRVPAKRTRSPAPRSLA